MPAWPTFDRGTTLLAPRVRRLPEGWISWAVGSSVNLGSWLPGPARMLRRHSFRVGLEADPAWLYGAAALRLTPCWPCRLQALLGLCPQEGGQRQLLGIGLQGLESVKTAFGAPDGPDAPLLVAQHYDASSQLQV